MIKIAEMFYSIQGEGFWTGTPMYFVRTSQCPVGGQSGICTSWTGRKFKCDTGPAFKSTKGPEWHSYTEITGVLDAENIWQRLEPACRHLVITGGEPVIQDIQEIVDQTPWGHITHIETSGIASVSNLVPREGRLWITLSPKEGWKSEVIPFVSEFKLLVDKNTSASSIRPWLTMAANRPLYLQPIDEQDSSETAVNIENAVKICMYLGCSLSLQTHKLLGIR